MIGYRVRSMRRKRHGVYWGPTWWYVQHQVPYTGIMGRRLVWRRCTQNYMTVEGAQHERDRLQRAAR